MFQDTYKPEPDTYTPAQVAEMCGVKTTTVHAWISRGEIRSLKVGHKRYISAQAIRDLYQFRRTKEYVDYTYAPKADKKVI